MLSFCSGGTRVTSSRPEYAVGVRQCFSMAWQPPPPASHREWIRRVAGWPWQRRACAYLEDGPRPVLVLAVARLAVHHEERLERFCAAGLIATCSRAVRHRQHWRRPTPLAQAHAVPGRRRYLPLLTLYRPLSVKVTISGPMPVGDSAYSR